MKKTGFSLFISLALLAPFASAQTQNSQKPAAAAAQATVAEPKKEDCGCSSKTPPPDIYGTVNGIKISAKDIDDLVAPKIKEMQDAVIEARKRELDTQINTRLSKRRPKNAA